MQFRDRDVANLAVGAFSAGIILLIALAIFDLWHHTAGPQLPILGTICGILGLVCAILAEYIRRWKGLVVSIGAFAFFFLWLTLFSPEETVRWIVVGGLVVFALSAIICSVPQIIVNLQPTATRVASRFRQSKATARTTS
jgi:hypothetical protein